MYVQKAKRLVNQVYFKCTYSLYKNGQTFLDILYLVVLTVYLDQKLLMNWIQFILKWTNFIIYIILIMYQ